MSEFGDEVAATLCRSREWHAVFAPCGDCAHLADALLASDLLARVRAEAAAGALMEARRPCGCAWCCSKTDPEKRGESHRRTCAPRAAEPTSRPGGEGESAGVGCE